MCYTTLRRGQMKLDVLLTPYFLSQDEVTGFACAVVDVLRATTTIVTAMVNGAPAVYPCLSADEAKQRATGHSGGGVLTGGEERGMLIEGFDLGNSPLEYTPETVQGKSIYFYTSNGSGAIRRAHEATGRPVCVASLANLSASVDDLHSRIVRGQAAGALVLCSGRFGKPSAEDTYCAGLIVQALSERLAQDGVACDASDTAAIAMGYATSGPAQVIEIVAGSEHAVFLRSLGYGADLEMCSRTDTVRAVPVFDGDFITAGRGEASKGS